jgi:hypothetical protein
VEARPKKLLDQVRDTLRLKHYSYRTEESYVHWIRRRSVERKVDITNLCPNPVQKSDIFAHYELLIASNLNKQPTRSDFCKVLPARFNTSAIPGD